MSRQLPIGVGISLILIGLTSCICGVVGPVFGLNVWEWGPWRIWPVFVVGLGVAFVLPPLLTRGRRGLGGLFIPGVPILVAGGILLFCSVFDAWGAWAWLWPWEVLAVAAGFLLATLYTRVVWLLVPTIVVGANGLLFSFCAVTGWWGVWSVLWAIEPLSLGIALLIVGTQRRVPEIVTGGVALCLLAVLGAAGSLAITFITFIFPVWWLWEVMVPVVLILTGLVMLAGGMIDRLRTSRRLAAQ